MKKYYLFLNDTLLLKEDIEKISKFLGVEKEKLIKKIDKKIVKGFFISSMPEIVCTKSIKEEEFINLNY